MGRLVKAKHMGKEGGRRVAMKENVGRGGLLGRCT